METFAFSAASFLFGAGIVLTILLVAMMFFLKLTRAGTRSVKKTYRTIRY